MKKSKVSIKWKIFAFLLGFCLLLLVILWLFQTVFLDSFYTSIKLRQVEKSADSLAALLEEGDTDAFEQEIRKRGDLFAELVDSEGNATTVEGVYPEMAYSMISPAQRETLYAEAKAKGGSYSQRFSLEEPPGMAPEGNAASPDTLPDDRPGGEGNAEGGGGGGRFRSDSVLHAKIVVTPDGEEQLLLVSAFVTPVDATVETLRLQLWYISGIMVVLAVGIALLIAKRVAGPIEKLNGTAKELAKGNYNVTFSGQGYREISELSATLDHTALELGKTETLRRELIANVSHDLRTPLTLITGYAEMMRDIPGENNPENMQVIIDEAKRLSSLVKDLMDLSQLQSGTGEMRFEQFDLTEAVRAIIDRFGRISEPEGVKVVFEGPKRPVQVVANEARVAQVIYNFLVNAMTHGGSDKLITVRQLVQGNRVRVEVVDRGEGIAADQLPYIWDRYYKVNEVHRRSATGSGLGLSIVKNILDQHPGVEYGADSVKGEGSCFWFSLPVSS